MRLCQRDFDRAAIDAQHHKTKRQPRIGEFLLHSLLKGPLEGFHQFSAVARQQLNESLPRTGVLLTFSLKLLHQPLRASESLRQFRFDGPCPEQSGLHQPQRGPAALAAELEIEPNSPEHPLQSFAQIGRIRGSRFRKRVLM